MEDEELCCWLFHSVKKKKKCDSHCWHSHCCRTFFAPMSHRTAGIRTVGIRTLVSFALLTPSHCWHSHCWLRTGVVRTSVFRTLVVQASAAKAMSRLPALDMGGVTDRQVESLFVWLRLSESSVKASWFRTSGRYAVHRWLHALNNSEESSYSTVGCRRTWGRRSQPGSFLFFTTPANLVLNFQSVFESRRLACSANTVCDDARRRSGVVSKSAMPPKKSSSQETLFACGETVLNSFSSLGSFFFLDEIPAWPFFGKPFFGTRQYCIGRKAPHVSSAIFQNGAPCNHGTSTTRVIIGAPSRSKRGAARCIDQTFTLNVNSNAMRSTCASHLKKNGDSHRSREVVLEHVEVCAPRAFFWTAVCLLCDE